MPPWSRREVLKGAAVAAVATTAGVRIAMGDEQPAATTSADGPSLRPYLLWYRQPAATWTEALPVGAGRIGAMVYGGVPREQIQFNEDTLWTGGPHEYQHEGAVKFLPQIRQLIADGKQAEAEELAMREFMSVPIRQKAYQPFGDLRLEVPGHDNADEYHRELDLDSAIARVSYRVGDVSFAREVFASYPHQVLVVRLTASKPGSIRFTATTDSPHKSARTHPVSSDQLAMAGTVEDGGMRFESRLRCVVEGGKWKVDGNDIAVDGADAATLLLAAATNYVNYHDVTADPAARCERTLAGAGRISFDALRTAHVEDHRQLFRRCTIDLGRTPAADLPTDERMKRPDKHDDPALAALYFQYGRYLLISSSRPGSQPANLQGIWNDKLNPPWDSKWTVNINTEMNYWPAETTGLGDCAAPLFDMIADCAQTGAKTAQAHYGARGWVLHHNTDLWRGTAPINKSNHGIWQTGGAWLCQHLWEHYLFTLDREFLATRAYPLMKDAAIFFTDALVEAPKTGWLISTPSNSPEHGGLVAGPSMDHQIIRTLFGNVVAAARILGVDSDLVTKLLEMRVKIAPNQVGRFGQLQEWLEDKDDPKDEHRHVSHLWAVFPGSEINPTAQKLFDAAKQSLIFRGDGGTGWSMAWKINLWARFLDGDHAHKLLMNAFTLATETGVAMKGGGTYPNLFDAHPPFQIDGNFGGTSGIAEMLLQSHLGEIHLLPALPKAWPTGSIHGLRARGGVSVDIAWTDGRLSEATLTPMVDGDLRVRGSQPLSATVGSEKISVEGSSLRLTVRAGQRYVVRPD